jgi:glutaminase
MTASPIDAYLARLHQDWLPDSSGAVADYIPPLALADPDSFGIAVTTTEGHSYEVGDSRVSFTIQSMSKPFTYGLALQDRGFDAVDGKVGVEPSGEAFNSISLAPGSGRPLNPMINAGAITSTSLVAGASATEREERVLDFYGRFAGRGLEVDMEVYEAERDTGHRNRAIGHMLRAFGVLEDGPDEALDLYFRQCSASVTCRDLSLMAGTLANGGVNPLTGDRVLERDLVDRVLSVMTTCGMYDSAGEWVVDVGMPAKSGVGGGVLAVLPGQLGIAVFSPPLDPHGNSVRGVEVCRQISTDLNLNLLHVARSSRSAVRRSYTVAEVPSRRRRPEAQTAALAEVGSRCMVQILHGDLVFAAMESVVRGVVERAAGVDIEVLDLTEVTEVDLGAGRLLVGLAQAMAVEGRALAIVVPADADLLDGLDTEGLEVFPDLDRATEWCEVEAARAAAADRPRRASAGARPRPGSAGCTRGGRGAAPLRGGRADLRRRRPRRRGLSPARGRGHPGAGDRERAPPSLHPHPGLLLRRVRLRRRLRPPGQRPRRDGRRMPRPQPGRLRADRQADPRPPGSPPSQPPRRLLRDHRPDDPRGRLTPRRPLTRRAEPSSSPATHSSAGVTTKPSRSVPRCRRVSRVTKRQLSSFARATYSAS